MRALADGACLPVLLLRYYYARLTRRRCGDCAVKTGRPDTGELSRGQNKVREVAREKFANNVTPTWQKGSSDSIVNIVGNLVQIGGFLLIVRQYSRAACSC